MNALPKDLFSLDIRIALKTAKGALKDNPVSVAAFARLTRRLRKAERRRTKYAGEGVNVPPLMIVNTTEKCNLFCEGCYANERGKKTDASLPDGRISELLDEASELGVSIVMLAGGEPLLSHGWLEAMGSHDEMLGVVFTNGTLLDEKWRKWFSSHSHMIPVLSIEGDSAQTDARRGDGVYARVSGVMDALAKTPFGISVTVTSQNIDSLLTDGFAAEYLRKGCRLFVFVEYVPAKAGTDSLMLSNADKKRLSDYTDESMQKHPALFIAFPGDEKEYGGCLAAGRGFIHISAAGDVEPCPFAPFSDVNLNTSSLKDALNSALLAKIRDNHHLLVEGEGGCALWHNRGWLTGLIMSDSVRN
jgi:MoaA/NifB/PqqE/SkfB family radical SAM enzyme